MHRLRCPEQDRANGDIAARRGLEQVVGDVGRIDIGKNQQVGVAAQGAVGHHLQTGLAVERHVAVHFAVDFQPWRLGAQQSERSAHLERAGMIAAAKIGVRQQRDLWLDAEAHHLVGCHDGNFGQFLGAGFVIHMRVDQEHLASGKQQSVHAGIDRYILRRPRASPSALADDLVDIDQMYGGGSPGSANHAVDIAFVQQHRADQRQATAHLYLGHLHGRSHALGHAVVGLPEVAVTRVVFDVDDVVVKLRTQPQTEFFYPLGDDCGPANQRWPRQAFVDDDLAGAQDALLLAL